MKNVVSVIFILFLLSCQKDNYEERHLPALVMNVPQVFQLDSVELSARILEQNFSELKIKKRGFVLAAEGFQENWPPQAQDESGTIYATSVDGLSFSADTSGLLIQTENFSGQYEAAPFLDIELEGSSGQRRIYGPKRTFFLNGIELALSLTEADHQVFTDFNVDASGATLSEYGLSWLVPEDRQGSGFTFSLEEVPEENIIRNPFPELALQFPLGQFAYLRPYAIFEGRTYYGPVEEIFIGDYWETISEKDYQSSLHPDNLYGNVGFTLNGYGYTFGGRSSSGPDDPLQARLWRYHPGSKEWEIAGTLPTSTLTGEPGKRREATAFVIGNKAYIGLGRPESREIAYKSFFEYSPGNGFRAVASYPYPTYKAASFVIDGKAYVGTGANPEGGSYFKFFSFNPDDDSETDENGLPLGKWEEVSAFPIAVEGAVGFHIGDKGYVGLGLTRQTSVLRQAFYEFDLSTWDQGIWRPVAPFEGAARQNAMSFVIEEKAYVGGGANFANYLLLADYKDFWNYNPSLDQWTRIADIGLFPRANAASCAIEEKGYIFCGYIQDVVIEGSSITNIYTPDQ